MIASTLESARERIQSLKGMPAAPVILRPLLQLLDQPSDSVDVDRVVQLISYDKSIAAQCLRTANSAMYSRRQAVDSLRGAVLNLGLWNVRDLIFSSSMSGIIPGDRWVISPVVFWRHSLGCALVCRRLAQLIRFPDVEKAYLAGLLHDLGLLTHSLVFPEEFREALEAAAQRQIPLHEVESERMGFTHCDTGQLLAEHWNIPKDVCQVIQTHHSTDFTAETPGLVALVHLSDLLCRLRDMGYGYYESRQVDFYDQSAWKALAFGCPELDRFDLARFTFKLDEYAEEVSQLVNTIFAPENKP